MLGIWEKGFKVFFFACRPCSLCEFWIFAAAQSAVPYLLKFQLIIIKFLELLH